MKDPTTELAEAVQGHGVSSGSLLYLIVDEIVGGNWQRSGSKRARPKPLAERLAALAAEAEARPEGDGTLTAEDIAYLAQFDPALQEGDTDT